MRRREGPGNIEMPEENVAVAPRRDDEGRGYSGR